MEIEHMSAVKAREITDRIKLALDATWDMIAEAWSGRVWVPLGYATWDDYCTREFGTSRIKLPREERQEVVSSMREIGMSTRAIASATGMGKSTVDRELSAVPNGTPESVPAPVVGVDGKTYTQPLPKETAPTILGFGDGDLDELNSPLPEIPKPPKPTLTEEEQDKQDEIDRGKRYIEAFVSGVYAAHRMKTNRYREEILAALDPNDRNTFLNFEKEVTWPAKIHY